MIKTIYIFNPDHDLALAANQKNFTPPHAGRQLRSDLGYLPALWAKNGDIILVEDKACAMNGYRKLKLNYRPNVTFIDYSELKALMKSGGQFVFQPWGWNIALCDRLERAGVPASLMPSRAALDTIRQLSSRHLAVKLLDHLEAIDGVIGFSRPCYTYEELLIFLDNNEDIVAKAPWSSSGRGVRYMNRDTVDFNALQWVNNTIIRQGSIIAEIRCNKVHDFAVEFMANPDGTVKACGLSVFKTERGAYTGNLLDTEEKKREWLSRYVVPEFMDKIVREIELFLQENIRGQYVGPLGVDMMITSPDFLLNPCIEINLRCTMGHVALALSNMGHTGSMRIDYENRTYKLRLIQN